MRYRSKPTECEARRWSRPDGTGAGPETLRQIAERIVDWVNANGGEARYEELTKAPADWDVKDRAPRIAARTINGNGWAYAASGHYIIKGTAHFDVPHGSGPDADFHDCLDFYPCDPETFEKRWEPLADDKWTGVADTEPLTAASPEETP